MINHRRTEHLGVGWPALICTALLGFAACGKVVGMDTDAGLPHTPDASVVGAPRWAMNGANPSRNGRSRYDGPGTSGVEPIVQQVSLLEADELESTLAVGAVGPEGTIYVHTRGPDALGQVHAVSIEGRILWSCPRDPVAVLGGLALSNAGVLTFEGRVVVPGTDSMWPDRYAFVNLSVGGDLVRGWIPPEPLTQFGVQNQFNAPLVDPEGGLYIILTYTQQGNADYTSYLHAFDAEGRARWTWDRVVGSYLAIPALGPEGTLYVIVDRGWDRPTRQPDEGLSALDASGEQRWFLPRASHAFLSTGRG